MDLSAKPHYYDELIGSEEANLTVKVHRQTGSKKKRTRALDASHEKQTRGKKRKSPKSDRLSVASNPTSSKRQENKQLTVNLSFLPPAVLDHVLAMLDGLYHMSFQFLFPNVRFR